MPKIQRRNLPPALLDHLLDRVARSLRSNSANWRNGKWFKRLNGMTVCGEGELVKTFLRAGQVALEVS